MVRTHVQLTEKQFSNLKKIAAQNGVSLSEMIRRGLEFLLSQEGRPKTNDIRKRAIEAAGKFRSGKSDVSEKHDKYLAEAYRS